MADEPKKDALVGNAADEKQVRSAKQKEQERALQEVEDLKFILGDKRGINFLRRMFVKTGLFRSSFTGNSTTFFNEGERNVGLWLSDECLKVNPAAYLQAIKKEDI